MKYFVLLSFLFVPFSFTASAQSADSCHLRISLLTCSPGTELYSTFGHTAIRVQNSTTGVDEVYNYGTFQFSPQFYTQFIRGKLRYFLSVERFDDFLYNYQYENRSVAEQTLLLSCTEKQRLYTALQNNALEEARYYQYDFLRDNCTTRAGNIIRNIAVGDTTANILPPQPLTFRNQIHEYLNRNKQWWSKFGIDLLLGLPLDKNVNNTEAQFLPDYLLKAMAQTRVPGGALVAPPVTILPAQPQTGDKTIGPLPVFALLLLAVGIATFRNNVVAQKFLRGFDPFLFLVTGLVGVLLLFMWFGTDHAVCAYNLNLLWALPTHAVAAFFMHRNKKWVRFYFLASFAVCMLLLISWPWLPQNLNEAAIPLVGCLALRSYFIAQKNNPHVAHTS